MKKSLLNIAVTLAFSSAVFSGTALSTQAFASELVADNTTSNNTATETYLYPGMGVGAASGAVIAGPVGLLVGGLIGAIAGANNEVATMPETTAALSENTVQKSTAAPATTKQIAPDNNVQLAQLGELATVVETPIESQKEALLDIFSSNLSLDIYFRSGSTKIESFYPARLAAIAELMDTMNQLEIHLDGYADRRGDKTKNIELASQRIEKVRAQLISAGVDENRIISKAFGETKMVSSPGDLEAYTFDRKVVIRFQRITADSIAAMTTALSEVNTEAESTNAVITDTRIEF